MSSWFFFIIGIFTVYMFNMKVSVSGGDADIHGKDCGYDEDGKSLCITGWTHNLVSGWFLSTNDSGWFVILF